MYDLHQQTLTEQPTAVIRDKVAVADLADWFAHAFDATAAAIAAAGSAIAGPPFARFRRIGDTEFDAEAGFPVTAPISDRGAVHAAVLPAGPAVTTWHIGPYDTMVPAYEALDAWVEAHGVTPNGPAWEIYVSEPTGDPATWRTQIVQPYRET